MLYELVETSVTGQLDFGPVQALELKPLAEKAEHAAKHDCRFCRSFIVLFVKVLLKFDLEVELTDLNTEFLL